MKYPLAAETFTKEEIEAAKSVLDSGRLTYGPKVEEFEHEFAAWTGSRHAVMVNSGSSANLLVVEALLRRTNGASICKPGDEVLVPALAWPTTIWPLLQLGLVPVLVDIDPKTLAIDLKSATSALTKKTKAFFPIHVLGLSADMDAYSRFCKKHGLLLIEDCCESLGAHFNGRHVGNFGLMASFSCYFSHHISTIEGGVVLTGDDDLRNDLVSFRSHGWTRGRSDEEQWKARHRDIDSRFLFATSGYNVRPTEIQAAIGLVQLKRLETMLQAREDLARYFKDLLVKHAPWLRLMGAEHLDSKDAKRRHSWMTLPIEIDPNSGVKMKEVVAHFQKQGVETRGVIAGNFMRHPAAKTLKLRHASTLNNADAVMNHCFMIGCHPMASAESKNTLKQCIVSLGGMKQERKAAA